MKRVAPPPSDEQLASAEQTDTIRRRNRLAIIEDQQEQERLASAGEPTAKEALQAMASVLDSRPIGEESANGSGNETTPAVRKRTPRAPKKGQTSQRNHSDRTQPQTPPQQKEEPDEDRFEEKAYKLMDLAYRKWEKTARKDLRKANHDLALDLGKDTALYLRSGIIRMNDLAATIDKLTASHKANKDGGDDPENFDDEMEEFRKQLRG